MFETYIYQPFFNILVVIYWLLGQINPELSDMGIAVILFALVVQIILFPLRLAGERSEEERRIIVSKAEEIKRLYSHEPIKQRQFLKNLMRGNARMVISTTINLLIQFGLILMLYRIFATGLGGADFHLLYSFVPTIDNINLMFLGKYDLTHTNNTLNILQSVMILVVELLVALRTTSIIRKKDVALMQIILPLGSYLIFMFLPAGKKLFVITALAFSSVYHVVRLIGETFEHLMTKLTPPRATSEQTDRGPATSAETVGGPSTPPPTDHHPDTPIH